MGQNPYPANALNLSVQRATPGVVRDGVFCIDKFGRLASAHCLAYHIAHTSSEKAHKSISGLVAEYIVAIDVTRARFPADALALQWAGTGWDGMWVKWAS